MLSLLIITYNCQDVVEKTLKLTQGLVDEIIAVDQSSTDKTVDILKQYKAKIYQIKKHIFTGRKYGLTKCSGNWVLCLDSDEVLSDKLKQEIKKVANTKNNKYSGYLIPYQNHFLGKPVNYGGENYKMLRLFKKNSIFIRPVLIHENFELKKGKLGQLKGKIYHYSYRSLSQTFSKFHQYAVVEAFQKKQNGETSSLYKILFYPPHMFYARFIKDKGYKDGLFRIPLDIGFAYMELITYLVLAYLQLFKKNHLHF